MSWALIWAGDSATGGGGLSGAVEAAHAEHITAETIAIITILNDLFSNRFNFKVLLPSVQNLYTVLAEHGLFRKATTGIITSNIISVLYSMTINKA